MDPITKEQYLLSLANLTNGALLGYEDNSKVKQYQQTVQTYTNTITYTLTQIQSFISLYRKIALSLNQPYTVSTLDTLQQQINDYLNQGGVSIE